MYRLKAPLQRALAVVTRLFVCVIWEHELALSLSESRLVEPMIDYDKGSAKKPPRVGE